MESIKGPSYEYKATLRRVIDGDTLDLDVDLGFEVHVVTRVRLYGINAPEMTGPTKQAGKASTLFVEQWCANRKNEVLIRSYKTGTKEKYGRWLVEVWSPDGDQELNKELLTRGLAVPYVP